MGIAEIGRVGDHQGRNASIPKGRMVAQPGVGQEVTVEPDEQRFDRQRRIAAHGLDDPSAEVARGAVGDDSDEIEGCLSGVRD